MAWDVISFEVWEWITVDGSTILTWAWQDFNPTEPTIWTGWTTVWVDNESYSYDLSWYQPWTEAFCCMLQIKTNNQSGTLTIEALRSKDLINWEYAWHMSTLSVSSSYPRHCQWIWIWVDWDEVWTDYPYYKFVATWSWFSWQVDSSDVRVYNLNIDDEIHYAWYIRVEWSHLCYTDSSYYHGSAYYAIWFKHKIAYDGNFSQFVWTDYSWKIWLETGVVRRIYYVDEYWYKRRTYEARNWYWSSYTRWQWRSVWYNKRWKIYVSDWLEASDWYAHLCFVNPNWYLMRILNWPVWWIE